MLIFGWIALGLASGLLASRIVSNTGEGTVVYILLGVGTAIAAGRLFAFAGASGLDIHSLVAAIIGASAVLFLYHAFFRPTYDALERLSDAEYALGCLNSTCDRCNEPSG